MIIIKGKHAVQEALKGTSLVKEINLLTKSSSKEFQHIVMLAKQKQIPVVTVDKKWAQKRYNIEGHQHIIAKISDIQLHPLSILDPDKHPFVIALDHLEDAFNVGAIMRTAEALGVKALILPKNRQAKLDSGVIKASSGGCYYLKLIQVANIGQALETCKKNGYWIYGADSNNGQLIQECEPNFPLVLVVGNEHKGMSQRIAKMVDQSVFIPMNGKVESLNVSVATGIIINKFIEFLNLGQS